MRDIGEAPHHLAQRGQGLLRRLLVAADILDLDVVVERLQVIGIGDVAVAGMELDEAVGGDDRFIEFVALVERISGHELRLGRPDGIRVLALDLVEVVRRLGVILGGELVHGGIVEFLDRPLDIGVLGLVGAAGGEQADGARPQRSAAPRTGARDGNRGISRLPL